MLNKLWLASIHLNLHPHFWHRCCSREVLWKTSTSLQAIKAGNFCLQEAGGTLSLGCSPLVYFCVAHGQEQPSNVSVLKGPSQSLPAPRARVPVISWRFDSVPQTQVIPGPEANVKWMKKYVEKSWSIFWRSFSCPMEGSMGYHHLLTPRFTSLQS